MVLPDTPSTTESLPSAFEAVKGGMEWEGGRIRGSEMGEREIKGRRGSEYRGCVLGGSRLNGERQRISI